MPSKSEEIKILPGRFDLVKKMYTSSKVIAANKKDLIFNWFFEQFGNYQNDKSSNTYELLWKTFHEILKIEMQNTSGHRILIKSNAVVNLLNAVTNYPFANSWASVILSSAAIFLQMPTVNATMIADIETLFLLLIATLKIICKVHECNCNDLKSLNEAKNLCNIILNILENLTASNDEEKALLLSGSLQDLALFMHIAQSDKELEVLSEKLAKKINLIIFNLKSKQYETLLAPIDSSCPVERPNTYILQFFLSLHNLLKNEDIVIHSITVNAACATLMKKLLTAFLTQNKFSLHFLKIMSLFFAIAGLDIPIVMTASTCCNTLFKEQISNSEMLIIGLSHLLEACSTIPQYFASKTVAEGYLMPSFWLKGVSAALLDAKVSKNKSSWLKCFHSLVRISPSNIESDVLPLIRIVLLNTSVHSTESKKHYCELFDNLLQSHSKLHQVPKFFVKLLLALTECIKENSGGNFLENGQILPQVQESIARCVQELPFGQMVELWKIFIETFSTLENMSQVFMVSKGFIFFVAQIFSIFLLHAQLFQANIPSNIYAQFSSLIKNTDEEIKKNISALKGDSKIVPLQRSVLLLCYAIGEVKLACNAYYGNLPEMPKTQNVMMSKENFDFSILHSFLDKDYVSVLETYINSDDKMISVLVFQLLLQKIKALHFKESVSAEDISHLKGAIAVVLKCLHECCSASKYWDMDICTVNAQNYGTVYWRMFLKVYPLLLNHLDPKDFYEFCHSAQSVILQDDSSDSGAKHVILASLKGEFFQESKHFQTAFVSAIWKQENLLYHKKRSFDVMEAGQSSVEKIFALLNAYHSDSLKYAQRTPKSNKKLGSIWKEIKEISDFLNNILLTESLPKDKLIISKTYDILKLFNSLPLDYLLPGNQMKCIIGLSLLFFLVPQSCKSVEAASIAKKISLVLMSIFKGVRSVWLFDFVNSGSYLKYVVKSVESVINVDCSDNHDWAFQLIEHLISLIIRNVESLSAAEEYISQLAVEKKYSRAVLISQYAMVKKLSQVLPRPHKQEKYKETLIRVSSIASKCFVKQLKLHFTMDMENTDHVYFIKCYMHVIEMICGSSEIENISKECFLPLPTILEGALEKATSSNIDVVSDIYLLFISKLCKNATKLSAFLTEDFVSVSWKIILCHFEEKRKKMKESLTFDESLKSAYAESSSNLCAFCSFHSNEKLLLATEKNCKNVEAVEHNNNKILSPLTLNEFEQESLKELSVITTNVKLSGVFHNLMKKLGCFGKQTDTFSLQMSILIFQCLIDANNEKCQEPLLNQLIQTCLSHLYYIANQACTSSVCQMLVLNPILDFISFVVRGNKGLPRQLLLQSLHCVVPVTLKVNNGNYALFVKSFGAAWKLVYDLFMHHTTFILATPAPFLSYVAKLLKSVIQAGAAKPLSQCDRNTIQQIQLCAQNMNRLLTVIARHKNEFSKLVPYLVADYVDTIQHITLDSNIKESILSGIHRLLDICSEESIKMQAVNISYVCQEIYGNLVKNYRRNRYVAAT